MLKYLLVSIFSFLLINSAFGKNIPTDTAVVFFNSRGYSVHSIDSADYFMMIMPPDSDDNRYNIKGFYKDGKIKFVGKGDPNSNSLKTGRVLFVDDYISYYKNGKRASIAHYKSGYKDGLEYLYYPNGTEYCCIKHQLQGSLYNDDPLNWECYDAKGSLICKDGNGSWVTYGDSVGTIQYEGKVIHGRKEGEWRGSRIAPDTIKYVYQYKKGEVISSIGYDKHGISYPFKQEQERATYRSGELTFVEVLRSRIKLPRNNDGSKMSIDTVHVSFVVEKDGHLDQFEVSSNVDLQLKDAIFAALAKSSAWNPTKIYGVPFRTRVILPLKEVSGYNNLGYRKDVEYREKVIKDN